MRRRRTLWITLLAVPLVVLLADAAYWWIASRNLRDGYNAWLANARAAGWTVVTDAPKSGGWPLAASLSIRRVTLDGGTRDIPGGLTWNTDRLVLRVDLIDPRMLRANASGQQKLRVGDTPEIPYTAHRLELALPVVAAPWPDTLELSAENLRGPNASVASLQFHLAGTPPNPLGFTLQARGISPPPDVARPFGPGTASLSLDGTLADAPVAAATPKLWMSAWHQANGKLALEHLALAWGPLDLTATAMLTLDDKLQPAGSASAKASGYAETLDSLATHSVISRSAATAAKAVLSLLATTPADGSAPSVEVPLTLRDRTLSMSMVPLLRLPTVEWH